MNISPHLSSGVEYFQDWLLAWMQILSIFLLCQSSSCQLRVHKMTTISQWSHPHSTTSDGKGTVSLPVILFINDHTHAFSEKPHSSVIGWKFIMCPWLQEPLVMLMTTDWPSHDSLPVGLEMTCASEAHGFIEGYTIRLELMTSCREVGQQCVLRVLLDFNCV